MDDMEKKTEEMKTGEVEMNQKMTERADWIDTQTYWYLMQLLEISTAEAEEKFPWNMEGGYLFYVPLPERKEKNKWEKQQQMQRICMTRWRKSAT